MTCALNKERQLDPEILRKHFPKLRHWFDETAQRRAEEQFYKIKYAKELRDAEEKN